MIVSWCQARVLQAGMKESCADWNDLGVVKGPGSMRTRAEDGVGMRDRRGGTLCKSRGCPVGQNEEGLGGHPFWLCHVCCGLPMDAD